MQMNDVLGSRREGRLCSRYQHRLRKPRLYQTAMLARRKVLRGLSSLSVLVMARAAEALNTMKHVVLLGDSIFDNGAYVGSEPDVVHQVRERLGGDWRATLNARDGAVLADIPSQLRSLPPDATHLVISAGGNDALLQSGILEGTASSVAGALTALAGVRDNFQAAYAAMLESVLPHGLPTAVCTIYDPRYPDRAARRIATAALSLLNDAITREAFARAVTLIDLRIVCDQDQDFANPIEPSARGGAKIAGAIASFLETDGGSRVIVK
jgi:hypothetical protein